MKKCVCFVDVDGVLNSYQTADVIGFGGWFQEEDLITHEHVRWGQDLVDNLKYIVEQTGAEIVISSTWRLNFSVNKFKEMFSIYGWPDVPVIDKTISGQNRGLEVNEWLSRNKVSSYVILDDNDWFLIEQKTRFVNTNIEHGLTRKDAEKAVKILLTEII